MDLRARIYGQGPARARSRTRGGTGSDQLPQVRDSRIRAGNANPLGGTASTKAYCWGRSQTGRCIRDFLYTGNNADANRPQGIRWCPAPRIRRWTHVDESPLLQRRQPRRATVRRPLELRGSIPFFICRIHRSFDRKNRRNPHATGDGSPCAAYPDGNRILATPRFSGAYRYSG